MKKLSLFILFAIFGTLSFSQNMVESKVSKDTTQYTYCQILGTSRFLSNKVTVEIDFGQFRSIWEDNRLKDPATGERIVFNSMIDALNYMGKQGWEFVQAYAFNVGNQNVYHFLMKKSTKQIQEEESKK